MDARQRLWLQIPFRWLLQSQGWMRILHGMPEKHIASDRVIDTLDDLTALVGHIETLDAVAVDCEMDSFFSYWGRICLIQIGDGNQEWVIDPKALDVSSLGPMFANPNIIKIFHDADQDIRRIKADFGFEVRGLFDTRAAAAALGVESPGLASIIKAEFDIVLSKTHQRANWAKRPLTASMLSYAQLDVAYLHRLMSLFEERLQSQGRRAFLDAEHARLEALSPASEPYHVDGYVRVKGSEKLTGTQRRYLRELYIARNEVAKRLDRTPFRVLQDRHLLSLVQRPPSNRKELSSHPGINSWVIRHAADELLDAIDRASTLSAINRPPPKNRGPALNETQMERFEALRKWRSKRAVEDKIDRAILMRREVMESLSRDNPTSEEELQGYLPEVVVSRFGGEVLNALANPVKRR